MGVEQASSEGIQLVIPYVGDAIDRGEQETIIIRFAKLVRRFLSRTPGERAHRFSTEDLVLGAER
jgi:hypothetical protein